MGEDSYTRAEKEDTRSLCERVGHDYREVSSRTKTKLERITYTEEDISFYDGFLSDGVGRKVERERARWVTRSIDVVTYKCAECGKTHVKES
jgi:hypothetical protein